MRAKDFIKEAEQSPYAIGMAKAMKMYKDKPPLKKKTIKKAHEIAKAVMKDDINQQADFEINFSKKMIDRGAREIYGKTGEDVEKMKKYYERRLVTWNGKKWKVYFDDAGYGAIDFLLVKPNDKYGSDPVATFNPFTKKVKELSMMKDDVNEEDLSNCKYGKYYCSTDKKYKCRQGPKQTRS